MKYRIINEKLQIANYKLSEMTLEELREFLDNWKPETKIGEIQMYLDRKNGVLVLNSEHRMYTELLQMAVEYLNLNDVERKETRNKAPKSLTSTMKLLELFHGCLKNSELIKKAEYVGIGEENIKFVNAIFSKYEPYTAISVAYNAGIISGKRIERARRKRGTTKC